MLKLETLTLGLHRLLLLLTLVLQINQAIFLAELSYLLSSKFFWSLEQEAQVEKKLIGTLLMLLTNETMVALI